MPVLINRFRGVKCTLPVAAGVFKFNTVILKSVNNYAVDSLLVSRRYSTLKVQKKNVLTIPENTYIDVQFSLSHISLNLNKLFMYFKR